MKKFENQKWAAGEVLRYGRVDYAIRNQPEFSGDNGPAYVAYADSTCGTKTIKISWKCRKNWLRADSESPCHIDEQDACDWGRPVRISIV